MEQDELESIVSMKDLLDLNQIHTATPKEPIYLDRTNIFFKLFHVGLIVPWFNLYKTIVDEWCKFVHDIHREPIHFSQFQSVLQNKLSSFNIRLRYLTLEFLLFIFVLSLLHKVTLFFILVSRWIMIIIIIIDRYCWLILTLESRSKLWWKTG